MKKQPNFSRSNQQGAVLVVGLVTLLVLTLLGITGMRTSIMEEKMSANLISQNIALQAADSCLQRGMLDSGGFTLDDSQWQDNYQNTAMGGGATAATYGAERTFRMYTRPPRNSGFSAVKFNTGHNEIQCTGQGPSNARVVLSQGIYRILPKN